jgi:hypothetical protein
MCVIRPTAPCTSGMRRAITSSTVPQIGANIALLVCLPAS